MANCVSHHDLSSRLFSLIAFNVLICLGLGSDIILITFSIFFFYFSILFDSFENKMNKIVKSRFECSRKKGEKGQIYQMTCATHYVKIRISNAINNLFLDFLLLKSFFFSIFSFHFEWNKIILSDRRIKCNAWFYLRIDASK